MNKSLLKLLHKLYFKQWSIGLCRGDINDIIKKRTFNPSINWLPLQSFDYFHADPFLLKSKDGDLDIFYEDFSTFENYGKISLMTVDENFNLLNNKILLDTKKHLSYPFIFRENCKVYVFPETANEHKLSCYEFNYEQRTLSFLQVILNLPLLDATILKYNDKYWLFGTMNGKHPHSKLYIYYSVNLLGPYTPHSRNPVKETHNGSRPAGSFIEIDGALYRPSQNCEDQYGESITINKLILLDEFQFVEEPYMLLSINRKEQNNQKIFNIHTINIIDDIIVVDGSKWSFSPKIQLKKYLRNKKIIRQMNDDRI